MFLEAAARIVRDPSLRTRLIVVGDGHLRKELEEQSKRLGLSDCVTFTGFREDAAPLCRALDIVALTSLNEGTPLTLIEAMWCARAVVATDVGGVRDLMGARRETIDGFTVWDHGVTVPSCNVEAFARALRFLIEHAELRKQLGERGRAFVAARMSKERLLGDVEQMYNELAGLGRQEEPSGERQPLSQHY
jgi:glycosyltransferase involved in cell wall biosynthesis